MIEKVRQVEQALGSGEKLALPVEQELRTFARRSVFAVRDIAAGERLTDDNIGVLRCGGVASGLSPKEYPKILGHRAQHDIKRDTPIQEGDYEAG